MCRWRLIGELSRLWAAAFRADDDLEELPNPEGAG